MAFVPGQRFISEAEPELGLGQVLEAGTRTLLIEFPAAATTRRYAHANAPLTRLRFAPGDQVEDRDGGHWRIVAVEERDDLLFYQVDGAEQALPETRLSPRLSLSQPLKRLQAGQIDAPAWFLLRRQALEALAFIDSAPLLGLCSGRTELLPHQLYIAHQVATRPAPRVLLCDEVGLGKTIEACLILQQQLFSGLAARVLILVPESLVHQWLVELLRRFNLRFTILDEARCQALTEVNTDNPFESGQFVLSSLALLRQQNWRTAALNAGWDLLVVDEAHHLLAGTTEEATHSAADSPAASTSDYATLRELAAQVPGLLLLTATPDQAGLENHFGLLQLLDPLRFHDFSAFAADQQRYAALAALLDPLANLPQLPSSTRQRLLADLRARVDDASLTSLLDQLEASAEPEQLEAQAAALLDALLDRHGTGRVVFRNTRRTVSGFPARQLHRHPLALPDLYQALAGDLNPERQFLNDGAWLKEDPRIAWLDALLRSRRQDKFLLICSQRQTAAALEEFLRLHRGVRSAVFHEGLSLVERDRAAAWFADADTGAQLLVCSEIGSEGRNFQFSHDLVLFDLPRNPDLLEQRIGRLDRIGQQHPVALHVPYFAASAQAELLHLHAEILGLFEGPNAVASEVADSLAPQLEQVLQSPGADHEALWQQARQLSATLLARHAAGRDRLLELNSCRPVVAARILDEILQLEQGDTPASLLQALFSNYGIDFDINGDGTWNARPGDDMLLSSFPQIPDEGTTFTLARQVALAREDLPFVNWLHPLVQQGLDLVLQDHLGKCAAGHLHDKRLPAGALVLEALFRVTVSAERHLQASRHFPLATLRAVVDTQKRSLGKALPADFLDRHMVPLDKAAQHALLQERRQELPVLGRLAQQVAARQLPVLVAERTVAMQRQLDAEIARLQALQAVNPLVPAQEIAYLQLQRKQLASAFATARLQLEAVRLLLVA